MTTQPEALQLADKLEQRFWPTSTHRYLDDEAAIELRRLHFKCDALLMALKSIECCTHDPVIAAMVRVAIAKSEKGNT